MIPITYSADKSYLNTCGMSEAIRLSRHTKNGYRYVGVPTSEAELLQYSDMNLV
jgi:hypothetical protein